MDLLLRQYASGGVRFASRIPSARNNIQKQRKLTAIRRHHSRSLVVARDASSSLSTASTRNIQLCGSRKPWHSRSVAWLSTTESPTNNSQIIGAPSEQLPEVKEESSQGATTNKVDNEAIPVSVAESTDVSEAASNFKYDLSTLHEKTSRLLNTDAFPVGSLNLETFAEVRELIWAWSELGSLISVTRSFDLLDRLVKEHGTNFHPDLSEQELGEQLNYMTLNTVVNNWYTCWQEQHQDETTGPSNAIIGTSDLLTKIEEWTDQCRSLGPQTKAFSRIMRALAWNIQTVDEAQHVESLLTRMVRDYQAGDHRMSPTIIEYNIVLSAMAKVKEPERADAILTRLCDNYDAGVFRLVPNEFSFGTVLFAWNHAKHEDGGQRAEAVLDTMIALGHNEEDESLAKPNLKCYHNVLSAWCGPRTRHGMEQAERFLQRMNEDFKMGNGNARPTADSYRYVIQNWSLMGYGEQSERALRWMYNDNVQNGNDLAKVTSLEFNYTISAWARSGAPHALERAFSLFENMQNICVKPDAATYGSLMTTLSRSKDRSAGEKAERLLREQQRQYKAGKEDCKLDAVHYNAAMHCWSSAGNASKTIALLRELVEEHKNGNAQITDERPFITAFAALSRSQYRDAAEQAESLFEEMNRLYESGDLGFQPSAASYRGLQGCWASAERPISGERCLSLLHEMQEKHLAGNDEMRPAEANYTIVIDAFARTRNPQRAEEVWYEMLQSFIDGNPDAKPGSDSCKAVLTGWLTSGAPDAIHKVLGVMERIAEVDRSDAIELMVNRNAYHLLLDICSKAEDSDLLAGAEAIVHKMKEVKDEGRNAVGPDTRCYNVAINCWGKHGSAERAESLFWEMYDDFIQNGNPDVKPDTFAISTVLTAWGRSQNENATRRAQVFFERIQKLVEMGKLEIKLDTPCYNALLHCLASARTGEAADSAESIFSDIQESHRITKDTHHSYYAFIKCLSMVGRLERAEEVLMDMHDLYCTGHKDLEPKKRICLLILRCWFSSGGDEAPARAEKLLRWMDRNLQHEEKPDARDYALLLRCWTRSRLPNSGKRTEALLREIAERFGARRPITKDCYADVVCAIARSTGDERAEELLLRMCNNYTNHEKGEYPPTPHLRAFIAVLAAYSRKKPPGSLGMRVLRLVKNLRDVDADSKTNWRFNSVLDVWNELSQDSFPPEARLESFLAKMELMDTLAEVEGKQTNEGKSPSDLSLDVKY